MTRGFESERRLARLVARIGSQYDFHSILGEGGAGTVYAVHNRFLDRPEALKVLSDAFQEESASDRFVQEAKVAASLDHPHIVKVYDFGQEEGIHWFSMQLVDGPSLAAMIEGGLRFDEGMFMQMAIPVLEALEFSHDRGVIHRDLKPANILFSREGRPCLTDFGVAKTEESVLRTRTGHLLGTPAYVSPEQALGEAVDARADQYSAGITFYKTLAGRLPFTADSVLQTLVLRLKEDPEPIQRHRPDLDPVLSEIIMRSLARDRRDRWSSVAEMRLALLKRCDEQGLAWHLPLARASEVPLVRTPLPALPSAKPAPAQPPPIQGSLEPTMDLPTVSRSRRAWWLGLMAVPLVALASWVAWPEPMAPAAPASPALPPPVIKPPSPLPQASAPQPQPVAPRTTVPASPIAVARRPAVYPQLVEASPVATTATGCKGLKVNVSLVVGEDGSVRTAKVLSNVTPECAAAAREAAMRYRFKPALDAQGVPLETTIAAAVDFPEVP